MLDDTSNDPIVVHPQVTLPYTADLSLGIYSPGCLLSGCDIGGAQDISSF
jgi:hypothetical protein